MIRRGDHETERGVFEAVKQRSRVRNKSKWLLSVLQGWQQKVNGLTIRAVALMDWRGTDAI